MESPKDKQSKFTELVNTYTEMGNVTLDDLTATQFAMVFSLNCDNHTPSTENKIPQQSVGIRPNEQSEPRRYINSHIFTNIRGKEI